MVTLHPQPIDHALSHRGAGRVDSGCLGSGFWSGHGLLTWAAGPEAIRVPVLLKVSVRKDVTEMCVKEGLTPCKKLFAAEISTRFDSRTGF